MSTQPKYFPHIGYAEFIVICRVEDRGDFAGFTVKETGVYRTKMDEHALSLLTPEELAAIRWHPTGRYDEPALGFPCSVESLRAFVSDAGLAGCIDEEALQEIVESRIQPVGEMAQMLAGWFDSPIDDLPLKPREIAEAYIPNWSELSGAERRARANEADLQVQATLGACFEKARRGAEQANAAMPARFAKREFQDGFDKVMREKAGERNFEARVAAVNLTDERCIQLAGPHELRIADWTALTGVGCGELPSYLITAKGVAFRNWTEREIREASVDQQIDMHRDNEAQPLQFPCAPVKFMQFIDAAPPGSHNFTVPEAFRRAVLTSERSTDVAAEAIQQVTQDQGCESSEANPEHEMLAKTPEESGDTGAPVSSEVARKNRQEHDITDERGCRRMILEHWDTIEKPHGPRAKGAQVARFLRNQPDNRESEPSLKTIRNRLIDLRKQKLIP